MMSVTCLPCYFLFTVGTNKAWSAIRSVRVWTAHHHTASGVCGKFSTAIRSVCVWTAHHHTASLVYMVSSVRYNSSSADNPVLRLFPINRKISSKFWMEEYNVLMYFFAAFCFHLCNVIFNRTALWYGSFIPNLYYRGCTVFGYHLVIFKLKVKVSS